MLLVYYWLLGIFKKVNKVRGTVETEVVGTMKDYRTPEEFETYWTDAGFI